MIEKKKFFQLLNELKKQKRNFVQTVELIINLKDFDYKKGNISIYVILKGIEKKVVAILEKDMDVGCDVLKLNEIESLDLKEFKKIGMKYDYFITTAKIVPLLAKKFGKVLGSMKKMPDPKLGAILTEPSKEKLHETVERIKRTVRIVNDRNSIKLVIGKENFDENILYENFNTVLDEIKKAELEKNVKEIFLKLTMSKPIRIQK